MRWLCYSQGCFPVHTPVKEKGSFPTALIQIMVFVDVLEETIERLIVQINVREESRVHLWPILPSRLGWADLEAPGIRHLCHSADRYPEGWRQAGALRGSVPQDVWPGDGKVPLPLNSTACPGERVCVR